MISCVKVIVWFINCGACQYLIKKRKIIYTRGGPNQNYKKKARKKDKNKKIKEKWL